MTPYHALWLSIGAAVSTIALKWSAAWLTGSVGFLSDALESLVNLLGASFALAMVFYARRPADPGHPFGHGKAEYFASGFEGILIVVAAAGILYAAGERIAHPEPLHLLGLDHQKLTFYHNGLQRRLTDVHGHVIREILA